MQAPEAPALPALQGDLHAMQALQLRSARGARRLFDIDPVLPEEVSPLAGVVTLSDEPLPAPPVPALFDEP